MWARQKAEEANQIQEEPKEDSPKIEELSISKEGNEGDLLILEAEVKNQKLSVLIDSDTTENFIKKSVAQRLGIVTSPTKAIKIVHMANKGTEVVDSTAQNISYKIEDYQTKRNFDLIPLVYHDVILGIPWLRNVNPQIN